MDTTRKAAVATGIFYIAAIVAGVLGMVVETPVEEAGGYLNAAMANQTTLLLAGLFIMAMAVSVAGIGISVYPVLKRRSEGIAAGYLGARIVESVLHFIGAIGLLLVVTLAKDTMDSADATAQTLSHLVIGMREWAYVAMDVAVFPVGALLFYGLMHRARLVPRGITLWGIIAVVLYFIAGILTLFGVIESVSTVVVVLNLPLALQELVLAIYLITQGFKTPVTQTA